MICRSLRLSLQLKTSHKFISIAAVSGFHLTIYSPLYFIFYFWHFWYKSSACHFKLFFQAKFNFKINRHKKEMFACFFFFWTSGDLWDVSGKKKKRRGGKKGSQNYFCVSTFFSFLPTQILLLIKLEFASNCLSLDSTLSSPSFQYWKKGSDFSVIFHKHS